MSKKPRQFVSFDWAMKKLLRSKANFDVLEGFLSELLKDDISIQEILESESNKDDALDKYNRVDLLVKDSRDQRVIIEVQYVREVDYFQRMLFGTSRVISENIDEGEAYGDICKVISVNIVWFDLGQGEDYVYIGSTRFKGMHAHDVLELSESQKSLFERQHVSDIFPDYYILKVNQFDNTAKDGLDEWLYFLKNEEIRSDFHAKGLAAAQEKLNIMKLSDEERVAYRQYEDDRRWQVSRMKYSVQRAEQAEEKLAQTQTLLMTEQKEKEEERRQKEEVLKLALEALTDAGIPEAKARKQLGLD
ncbi:hypothetical protein BVY04_00260 [bacterium M21]|nr:hypothetical protein BVY04_00260 [bacterium M21]